MNYKGVIIEESLADKSAMEGLKVLIQEVEQVEEAHETPWLEKWTCDTVEIPESDIDAVAERLSKAIDMEHCENWYCDFKNDQWHYVVFFEKIFKSDR